MMKKVTIQGALVTIAITCALILILAGKNCSECYAPRAMVWKLAVCGIVIILISIFSVRRYRKTENMVFDIANQPLLETHEAVKGVSFSGEGVLVADSVLESHFTNTPCLYYHSILRKEVGSGKSRKWITEKDIIKSVPLYVEDSHGRLRIDVSRMDADNAKARLGDTDAKSAKHGYGFIDCEMVLSPTVFKVKKNFFSSTKFEKSEYVFRQKRRVFVYGYVESSQENLVLKKHEKHPLIISRQTHKQFIDEFYKGKHLLFVAHGLILFGYSLTLFSLGYLGVMHAHLIKLLFFAGWVMTISLACLAMYNRMVDLRVKASNAYSNIEGELQRRFDLIPNLVSAVKQYGVHESEIQNSIAEIRSGIQSSTTINSTNTPTHSGLTVLVEKYPTLKASENFMVLMTNLTDTEERIAYSREFYNNAVRNYNTFISLFPFSVIARFTKSTPLEFIRFEERTTNT